VAAVSTAFEALAERVAAARRARALHPRGRTFTGRVRVLGGDHGVDMLDRAGEYRALVRFSRGLGLPAGWPDVLGVALRIRDAAGPGADVDVLTSTIVARAPLARHVPMPRRRLAVAYTTVAGYGTGRGRRYLAVLPDPVGDEPGADLDGLAAAAARGRVGFLLAVASLAGRWRVFGRVDVDAPTPPDLDRAVAFDPVLRGAAGLRTEGWLWRSRAAAYRGSRAGRGSQLAVTAAGWEPCER
jgi:hypothetical protein